MISNHCITRVGEITGDVRLCMEEEEEENDDDDDDEYEYEYEYESQIFGDLPQLGAVWPIY